MDSTKTPRLRAVCGQSAHAPVPSHNPTATLADPPSEQMTDAPPVRCLSKSELAAYLGISVRTLDLATAERPTPLPTWLWALPALESLHNREMAQDPAATDGEGGKP